MASETKTNLIKYLSLILTAFGLAASVYVLADQEKAVPEYLMFSRNLTTGASGLDVLELQKYLNNRGFLLNTSGIGSPGQETEYFGSLTQKALAKFQEANAEKILAPLRLSKGTGVFGPATREFINLDLILASQIPDIKPALITTTTPVKTLPATTTAPIMATSTKSQVSGSGTGPITVNGGVSVSFPASLTFNDISKTYGDGTFTPTVITPSGGNLTFVSSNPLVATASGQQVTVVGVGTSTITVYQAASGMYGPASASATLTVAKKNPAFVWQNVTVDLLTVAQVLAGGVSFPYAVSPSPSSDSDGTFYLNSGNISLFSVNSSNGTFSILQYLDPGVATSYNVSIGQLSSANFNATTVSAIIAPNYPDDCTPNPCQYGGTCSKGYGGITYGGFTCSCPSGMTGTTCGVAINACASNPCVHGTCNRTSTVGGPLNSYVCVCQTPWIGTNCDINLSEAYNYSPYFPSQAGKCSKG